MGAMPLRLIAWSPIEICILKHSGSLSEGTGNSILIYFIKYHIVCSDKKMIFSASLFTKKKGLMIILFKGVCPFRSKRSNSTNCFIIIIANRFCLFETFYITVLLVCRILVVSSVLAACKCRNAIFL